MIHHSFKYNFQESSIIMKSTQFGDVSINLENTILFPNGLIGLASAKHFCLARINHADFKEFALMQGVQGNDLSFLTLPIALSNGFIEDIDIQASCKFLGIEPQDAGILLIASTKIINNQKRIIVNVRAPVFIDAPKKIAMQYVISGSKYNIQHEL